jgi:ABC-type spermidine/putrescine transport system permease subunit I
MNTWADFWSLVLPVFTSGITVGCLLCRVLVDYGWMHP